MKKQLIPMVAICLALAIASLTGCGNQSQTPSQEIVAVQRGNLIIATTATGNLDMPHQTELKFRTAGTIKEIYVNKGDKVTEGQVLANLDDASLQLAVKIAETDLKIAEETLMQTIYPQYTNIYGTDLPGTKLAIKDAQDYLKEAQEFLASGKVEEAQASLELCEEKLSTARDKVGGRVISLPLSIKLKELQAEKAKLALAQANEELKKAQIIAPFTGIVADINVKEGDQLSAITYSTTTIIPLIDPSLIEISGIIDEIDIPGVEQGQEATITLDALPGTELKGKVTFISPVASIQAGIVSYKITITLEPTANAELREGMTADADIIIERHEDVLLIPNLAIKGTLESPWVEVVANERSKQTEQREVILGASDGVYTEVLSGLKKGEEILVEVPTARPRIPFF